MVWSTVIPAAASVVGGLLGKSKVKGPDFEDQLAQNSTWLQESTRDKINIGKEFGIHPLTMLGVQNTYSPSPQIASSGSNLGESIGRAGMDVGRAMAAGSSSNMEKLQERLLLAQIKGQEIDNVSRASMLARTYQPGNPPAASSLNEKLMQIPGKLGSADGVKPLHQLAVDENGNITRIWNEDLGDSELMQALHAMRYSVPDNIHAYLKPLRRKAASFGRRMSRFWHSAKSAGRQYGQFRK